MDKEGYDRAFTAALIACASTMANLIPPSIMAVVYGATGNVSIGGLFLAGIVPGVLIGIGLMIYSHFFGPVGILKPRASLCEFADRGARLRAAADDPAHHHGRHPDRLVHADRSRHGRVGLYPRGADPAAAAAATSGKLPRDFVYTGPALLAAAGAGGGRLGLRLDARLSARPRHRRRAGSRTHRRHRSGASSCCCWCCCSS